MSSYDIMPSVGDVKILVLPIEFNDMKISEEEYAEIDNTFFGEYDENKTMYYQSLKSQYEMQSYGKLRISGDILPIYTSEKNRVDCSKVELKEIITEALASYEFLHNNFSQYDSDGDGYIDGLYIKYAGENGEWASTWWPCVGSGSDINLPDDKVKIKYFERESVKNIDSRTCVHETGHLMGLLDGYSVKDKYEGCDFDSELLEVMRSGVYFNMYYKYLLGWITEEEGSAVILTYDDLKDGNNLKDIDLFPVERYGDGVEYKPKVIFLIPDRLLFPYTEFYVAEYRTGGLYENIRDYFANKPGIVIWKCDTDIGWDLRYNNDYGFIKSVYKSNSGGPFKPSKDLYFAGDEFSSATTPSSSFNNDIYTGAYLKVNSLNSEKASVTAGYKDPIYLTPPNIKIETDKNVVKAGDIITYTITYDNYTDIPWTEKKQNSDIGRRNVLINKENSRLEVGRVNTGEMINENQGIVQLKTYSFGLSGWVSMTLGAGTAVNGLIPAREITSPRVYVDNSRPKIILNGDKEMTIPKGSEYVEPGITVTDDYDENPQVVIEGKVDTSTKGIYTIKYIVTDSVGHVNSVARKVTVYAPFELPKIEYSTTEPTNGNVTVVITPTEKVIYGRNYGYSSGSIIECNIEETDGYVDKVTVTFSKNGYFDIALKDEVGNSESVTAKVTWIDKTPPSGTVKYSPSGITTGSVTATLTTSEKVKPIEMTHTFTENGSYTFEFEDLAGNKGSAVATVDWIIDATPTPEPTATPTLEPTSIPTSEPTSTPTLEPTATPTSEPTATPTLEPTATPIPTATPTLEPTAIPTVEPTATPTLEPTQTPTSEPEYKWQINGYEDNIITITAPKNSDGVYIIAAKYNGDYLADCEVMYFNDLLYGINEIQMPRNIKIQSGETLKIMLWDNNFSPLTEPLVK